MGIVAVVARRAPEEEQDEDNEREPTWEAEREVGRRGAVTEREQARREGVVQRRTDKEAMMVEVNKL